MKIFSICIMSLLAGSLVFGEPYITESFTGTTASDWTFVTGAGSGPSLTAYTAVDTDGEGWLRLNEDAGSQSSFVYCENPISATEGLVVEFDFVTWGSTPSLGDGFAFVIFDATVAPDAGGYGGSLGYAQRRSGENYIDGLAGGIVGFGFDEFGNFAKAEEGREGGVGYRPRAITIRGSMGATRAVGYEYITNTLEQADFSTGSITTRSGATIHSVRITIPTDKKISIEWKVEGDAGYTTLLDEFQCSLTCPDSVKIGFTAGTGGAMAYHEIQNLSVASAPVTTSSGIDLRAFQTSEGTVVEFVAYDVESDGTIQLALMGENGEEVWQGSVAVTEGPKSFARFLVPSLVLGKSYNFQVRDEVGKWWEAKGVTIEPFAAEMTSASLAGMTLVFDSLPGHDYEVQWVPTLGSPWQTVTNLSVTGLKTEVVVTPPDTEDPLGFFRVRLK